MFFPWITRDGEHLKVSTPELFQHPDVASREFLNFVTITGPARQGKSFLMNSLMGNSVFDVSHEMNACTIGVNVATVGQEVEGGYAFFVDTEGRGNQDDDNDITLLTPILLLSKVILFNWKGGLQIVQILNELAILVEVAKRVSSDSSQTFGHLFIVLRDFHFTGML